jgi:hypothetical protein
MSTEQTPEMPEAEATGVEAAGREEPEAGNSAAGGVARGPVRTDENC